MLYFLHGDPNKTFQKSQKMTEALLKKKPDASIFKINDENFSVDKMTELLGGQGLFENKYIVTISCLLNLNEIAEYIMEILPQIQDSKNIFIWIEKNVTKSHLKIINKYAAKVEFTEVKKSIKHKMNVFDLASAFANNDKKRAWLLYQRAIKDFSPEEIYGTLWWQTKSMLICSKTQNAKEAGMKEFPYKKAQQYVSKYTKEELNNLAQNLINVYHQSRLDSEDLILNLEKFLLTY